jgi:hypothetical protein
MYGDYSPDPGDIGFSHNTKPMARCIQFGEWLKLREREYNHEFVVDRVNQFGVATIIQATLSGVTDTMDLREVAPGGSFTILTPPPSVDVEKLLEFCRSQVGIQYSILTIAALALDIVSWNWVPTFMNAHRPSWICSGLINEGLRYGGWLHQWTNIYTVMPQQGYDALTAENWTVRTFTRNTEWPYNYRLQERSSS